MDSHRCKGAGFCLRGRMGSPQGDNNRNDRHHHHLQQQHPPQKKPSLYTLTLNDVQHHLGAPIHTMNLDDLLRSVHHHQQQQQHRHHHHPSSLAIDLESANSKKKTVDEVWRDIQRGKQLNDPNRSKGSITNGLQQQPSAKERATLGEMTLEDFLTRAGMVSEEPSSCGAHSHDDAVAPNADPMVGVAWYNPRQEQQQEEEEEEEENVISRAVVVGVVGMEMGALLDSSTASYQDDARRINMASSMMVAAPVGTQTPRRKRVAPGGDGAAAEKTVERKQKRMIKNRESAARSRARKQAYTHELENKISRLEEENERLKKQTELDRLLYHAPPPEPNRRLRRTTSSPF